MIAASIFEFDNRRFDRVERRAFFLQNLKTYFERIFESRAIFFFERSGHFRPQNRSRTAVNCQSYFIHKIFARETG
jgi:hypothetical protein